MKKDDIIKVIDENNLEKEYNLLAIFTINGKQYIVYKDINNESVTENLLASRINEFSTDMQLFPLSDEEIYNDIFYDMTVGTFSNYYPREYVLPADLSKLRVKTATESTSSDISDIYELPNLFPLTLGNEILSIAKIVPFNDMRYEATTLHTALFIRVLVMIYISI